VISLAQQAGEIAPKALLSVCDRAVSKGSLWRCRLPQASLRIKRRKIPEVSV
jgi:hypothetical protein